MYVFVYLMQKHLQCEENHSQVNKIIPGGECMKKLMITRSDIRMQRRLSILKHRRRNQEGGLEGLHLPHYFAMCIKELTVIKD